MEKIKIKLQRRTAFDFMKGMSSENSKSITGHPTTTTATTQPTITFLCKV